MISKAILWRRCRDVGIALGATLLLAACGGNNDNNANNNTTTTPQADACKDVECERGVCQVEDEQAVCKNTPDCDGDDSACLAGYSCVNDLCRADTPCKSDGTCERGTCDAGACLNPEMCTTTQGCLDGYFCDSGSCELDPCGEDSCGDGGVCEEGTGSCLNPATCQGSDECLPNFACISGSCEDETSYCADLNCARGECSFEERECVSAASCGGDDEKCLAGEYCASDNTCKPNICDTINQTCERGDCERATGECVNPATCDAASDCLDGFRCITSGASSTCQTSEESCATLTCEGNQLCDYDESALATQCVESDQGCAVIADCVGDRVCRSGACVDAPACSPDGFEPNNAVGEEVLFLDNATAGLISGLTLCDGDVDRFGYAIDEDPEDTGLLLVNVKLNPEDVGAGKVKVTVLNGPGFTVSTATNEDADGNLTDTVRIEDVVVSDIDMGVYKVIVEQEGALNPGGIRYSLQVDLANPNILNACEAPALLAEGTALAGSFSMAQSSELTTTCADGGGSLSEVIYRIDVTERVYATFLGQGASNISLSLRGACTIDSTELVGGCVADAGAGGIETLGLALEPGAYFLVVQAEDATGGNFVLSYTTQPITCDPAVATMCVNATTAQVCNDSFTDVRQFTCEFGCDSAINGCTTKTGDVCSNPILVDPVVGFSGDIERDAFNNDYDPGDMSCVPDNASSQDTDGPDTVFQLTVPDGKVLVVSVEDVGGDDASIYITEDCADVANSCIVGTNASGSFGDDELLIWRNESGMDKTIFVIMDVEIESLYSDPEVNISVQDFVCTPGSAICGTADRESLVCNDIGTGYTLSVECGEGNCNQATGRCATAVRDNCGGAEVLTSGVTTTGVIDALTDEQSDTCNVSTAQVSGPDAVFVVQNVQQNDRLLVEALTGFDSLVYVAQGCDLITNTLGACLLGVDADTTDTTNEEGFTFTAPNTGDYYIVIDVADATITSGSFELTVTTSSPSCTPNTFLGCSADGTGVSQCDSAGFPRTVDCSSNVCDAASSQCTNPNGDTCGEALVLTGTMGQILGEHDASQNSVEVPGGYVDRCILDDFDQTDGNDTIYAIDLIAGDLLTADFSTDRTTGRFYLQQVCGSPASCYGSTRDENTGFVQYYAEQDERIFMVIDSTSTSTSTEDWTLDWKVEQGFLCAPDQVSCADATTQRQCDSSGTNFIDTSCSNGCAGLGCTSDPVATDICTAGAVVDLGLGATIVIDPDDFTGTADPEACADGDGAEAFYSVTAQAGDLIEIVASGKGVSEYPSAYIFSDCADVNGTCLAGATATFSSGYELRLIYQAPASQTYLIGLDSASSFDNEPMIYSIRTLPPECSVTDPLICDVSGQNLLRCVDGLYESYACLGGCSNGLCGTPQGDICEDAISLTGLASPLLNQEWDGYNNTLDVGSEIQGACVFESADAPDGAEVIYSIDLTQGDVLDITLESSETNALLYVVSDCSGLGESCVANDFNEGNTDDRRVTFTAQNTQTYFIVVDRQDTSDINDYDLSWTVTSGLACAPNQFECIDPNVLGLCNSTGTATVQSYTCPSGCNNGICTPDVATWDMCATAPILPEGIHTIVDRSDFTNSYDGVISCVGTFDLNAPDFYFQVELPPNTILDIEARSLGFEYVSAYIFTDCTEPDLTCLGGDEGGTAFTSPALVNYQSGASAETVYVGIDGDFSGDDEPVVVTVRKRTPDCVPGQFTNVCTTDGLAYEYCDASGFIQRYECEDANLDGVACTMGRCDEPVGDTCDDPFEVLPNASGAFTMTGLFADAASDTTLSTGNKCTGSLTRGPDPTYGVNLLAGQTLTASLVSTASTLEDVALYITTDCDRLPASCVAGADILGASSTPETASYTATQAQRVYIVLDSYYSSTSGEYSLDVSVQ